ncbi:polysaccharide deacetylase family protein [Guyparkeria hydrothermalis]|uniref:polysaccharide deacetylase family protein n=1 Tax=Guyparkeria hydrothermalis TaxID=923 RepID=UPI002021BB3B|nr:polysaccharide deacetylase family protein [Guyparkeria hydrothermalis]MCL7743809.1 polysaccharide deacetylase family protein [Guyparkeria hydrothermalis]
MSPQSGGTPRSPVMLSFDDGPRPGYTDRVLDVLSTTLNESGAPLRAGFFALADNPLGLFRQRRVFAPYELWTRKGSMIRHPQLARRIVEEGHWLGNHGGEHFWPRWPRYRDERRVDERLAEWEAAADVVVPGWRDQPMTPARAPYLVRTAAWRQAVTARGYRDVAGLTTGDAVPRADRDSVARELFKKLEQHQRQATDLTHPVILIFHDIRAVTATHLGDWLVAIREAGYPLVDFDPMKLPPAEGGSAG